jgi:hypothetical protein
MSSPANRHSEIRTAWNSHEEYAALHDDVSGYVDWSGAAPKSCPYGGTRCADMIMVLGQYAEDCPRFGGCKSTDREGPTKILCRGKRYFDAQGQTAPEKAGSFWKDAQLKEKLEVPARS